ncbi:MAG: hypothetical protein K9L74_02460 [Candidatus Izimaplasma sp.]|nr:hypothetical protein [Candidatus Izimaplasma bacterium]
MNKVKIFLMVLVLSFVLSSCSASEERVVIEKSISYDLIGIKAIEVNGEVFSTFCLQDKEGEGVNVFGTKRVYTDIDGIEYSSYENGTCVIVFNDVMYHGFDLLEDKTLTVEELELLEFPFEKE